MIVLRMLLLNAGAGVVLGYAGGVAWKRQWWGMRTPVAPTPAMLLPSVVGRTFVTLDPVVNKEEHGIGVPFFANCWVETTTE